MADEISKLNPPQIHFTTGQKQLDMTGAISHLMFKILM